MPRGDGTGPMGLGPMTGRAAGYCAGFPVPGYMNPVGLWGGGFWRRLGRGLGFGRGRGWRRMYYATGLPGWVRFGYPGWAAPAYRPWAAPFYPAPFYGVPYTAQNPEEAIKTASEQEMAFLKEQAEFLKEELKGIEERLKELGGPEKGGAEEGK
ncbi:MAG: DUF5320 domain-containing protein [Firmicutes bacterium]|nr:DUF5320 domain-containing protein [Bacillota bacterium]